jgi:hypothetical protein
VSQDASTSKRNDAVSVLPRCDGSGTGATTPVTVTSSTFASVIVLPSGFSSPKSRLAASSVSTALLGWLNAFESPDVNGKSKIFKNSLSAPTTDISTYALPAATPVSSYIICARATASNSGKSARK